MAVKADITIDIDKQVGELQNLSQIYNARVGDNKTPLTVAWRKNDLPLNLKGLHAYIVGKTGDGSFNEETGKIDFPVGTPVSQFEDDGTGTLDGGQSGLTTLLIPKQMWQKSGVFAGYIGLKSADGSVFTSKDIWFKVLGNVLDAGVEINYFIGDFDKALAEAEKKLQDKTDSFDQVTNAALDDIKNKYQQESAKLEESYKNSLGAAKDAIETDIAALNKLSVSVGTIQDQINAKDIVTRKEHHDDIAKLDNSINDFQQSANKTLAGISKTGPYFFDSIASIQAQYPTGHQGMLVTKDNLHWYYWDSNKAQYIDGGKFTDTSINDLSFDRDERKINRNYQYIRSSFASDTHIDLVGATDLNATKKADLSKKYIIPCFFSTISKFDVVYLTSITVKPYQEGKISVGVARPMGAEDINFITQKVFELTTTDIQTFNLSNLEFEAGDYLTISGPVYYSENNNIANSGFKDKIGTDPINGIADADGPAGALKYSLYLTAQTDILANNEFPTHFPGKQINAQDKDLYSETASTPILSTSQYLIKKRFSDNGKIYRIYYDAPQDGHIYLATANDWPNSGNTVRIHNNVKLEVKAGKGTADIELPFFANDFLIIGGQIYCKNDDSGYDTWENTPTLGATQYTYDNQTFNDIGSKFRFSLYFDEKIDDSSHFDTPGFIDAVNKATAPLNSSIENNIFPLENKKFVCLGDSIWSDQVAGIGTIISSDLKAKLVGNFAVGWATASDWHDETKNITPQTLTEPNNTDTADNVLSNQVRRVLQWTTAKDQQITWHHPLDGDFNIDKSIGVGLGHTEDIPDVIAISISTNDGKNNHCLVKDDVDDVINQDYKSLSRISIASAIRWAIETLRSAYPNVQIFVCTPLQTNSSNTWMSYQNNLQKSEIIKKICQYCSVPVIDQFSNSGFSKMMTVAGTAGDYIHPTGNWKQKIALFNKKAIEDKYLDYGKVN